MMGLQDEVFETIRNPKKALKAAAAKNAEKVVLKKEEKIVKTAKVTKVKAKEEAKPKKAAKKTAKKKDQ